MVAFGNGLSLDKMRRDPAATSIDSVRARWGDAFLLVHTTEISAGAAENTQSMRTSPPRTATPFPNIVVYPVRRRPGSSFDWISIGRNDGNDIYVPHSSVSRFHALLRDNGAPTGAKGFGVNDAKSANGTFVGDTKAPRAGEGAPLPLKFGQTLRFGEISATLLDATALHAALGKK